MNPGSFTSESMASLLYHLCSGSWEEGVGWEESTKMLFGSLQSRRKDKEIECEDVATMGSKVLLVL